MFVQELHLNGFIDPESVVELGNQTVNIDANTAAELEYTHGNGVSAEMFYRSVFGYKRYYCIDTNGRDQAIDLDINEYLNREIYSDDFVAHFDGATLVTNNGTGEHVFDQRAVFALCHDLCIVDGVMVHILPFINWINHSFYSYHPLFFIDLAQSNGYTLLALSVGNRWGKAVDLLKGGLAECVKQLKPKTKSSHLSRAISEVMSDEKDRSGAAFPNVMVCAALRKNSDAPFRVPFQAKYIPDIANKEVNSRYR